MLLNSESFELRILKKKRRVGVEEFKKGIKRKLYFIVPAQEAKSGQPLAPILGQVQINTFDFVTAFNTKTQEYPKGTLIFVELIVMWDKTYVLNLKTFPFHLYIHEFVFTSIYNFETKYDSNKLIFILDVYKLVLLYKKLSFSTSLKECFNTVLGSLNSFNIKITLFSETEYLEIVQFVISNHWDIYMLIEKNIKGFGVYNNYLYEMLELLEFDLLFLEDRKVETDQSFINNSETEEIEEGELLEY